MSNIHYEKSNMSMLPVSCTTHNAAMRGIGKFTTLFPFFLILTSCTYSL